MTATADILSALKRRTLEIDCIDMVLVQNAASNPISFKGKGYIRQTDADTLTFKLYAVEVKNTDSHSYFKSQISVKSGELFSESEYYRLSATASDGCVWTADRIIPYCRWPAGDVNPIVTGDPRVLSTEFPMPDARHSLCLHFFEEAEIPCMVDKFEFSDNDYKFVVKKHDNEFTVDVSSSSALCADFHIRIQEALRFLLAQSVAWRGLYIHEEKRLQFRIASGTQRSSKTRLYPPISHGQSYLADSWRLFLLYLEYINKNSPENHWNICSYHLHNACESSANSMDAWANGLCIAVEWIADIVKAEHKCAEKKLIENMNKHIIANISSHECFKAFAVRVEGLLGMMLREIPQDRLQPLIDSGHVEAEHLKAWQKLRNKGLHPQKADLKNMAYSDFQQIIDRIHKVTVLMYHITFYIIGYEGKFTDYATLNFPVKDYPLTAIREPSGS